MAAQPQLVRLGGKPPLGAYLRGIWDRREFATAIGVGELRAQNMDTVLGNTWHLLNPLMLVGVYYLVFGVILGLDREPNFLGFLTIGVFLFHYTQKSVVAGAKTIVSNLGLIRSIQFPRATLPIATVISQTLAFLPGAALMVVVSLLLGETPRPLWLLLFVIFALQALFNLGAAFVVARLTDSFYDLQNVLPYIFRLLFYMSGVLYSVDRFLPDESYRVFFTFNPMYAFITMARDVIREDTVSGDVWASAVGWTVFLVVGGLLYFRAGEQRYGRG